MNIQSISDMKIATLEAGYMRIIRRFVKEGFIIESSFPINEHRYMIVRMAKKQSGYKKKVMIAYKRDVFHNFGRIFRDQGYSGVADTINCDDLKIAIREGVETIYTIFPNGRAYFIELGIFLEKSVRWVNREGKEVRSIPINWLAPFGDL